MGLLDNFLKPVQIGLKPKTPEVKPQNNTLPQTQVKTVTAPQPTPKTTTSSSTPTQKTTSYDDNVAKIQTALNNQYNAGLKVDGISGPLTQAAIAKYSQSSTPTTQSTSQPKQISTPQTTNPTTQYSPSKGLYGQLVSGLANQSNAAQQPTTQITRDLASADYSQRMEDAIAAQNRAVNINQQLNQAVNDQTKAAIPIGFIQGRQGAIQRDFGVQAQAANQAAQNAYQMASLAQGGLSSAGNLSNSQQGLIQQALSGAAGFAAPQFPSYQNAQFDPTTGQYGTVGGGQYGSGPAAASNIQSIQQYQSQLNNIQAKAPAVQANLQNLISYANQLQQQLQSNGLPPNVPIIQGIQSLISKNVLGNQAASGFNAQLQNVRQAWTDLGLGDGNAAIPDNVTAQQLAQKQQVLQDAIQNQMSSYQNELNRLQNSGGSSGGTPMFGSFF